jgi:hypothetical protein
MRREEGSVPEDGLTGDGDGYHDIDDDGDDNNDDNETSCIDVTGGM